MYKIPAIVFAVLMLAAPVMAQDQKPVEKPASIAAEMQSATLDLLKGLRNAVESGVAFAKEQIPQVLWEKILVDRVYYTLILLSVFPVAYYGANITKLQAAYTAADKARYDEDGPLVALAVIRTLLAIASGIYITVVVFSNTYPAILVWFAPRLYLLEWVRSLL